jgi:ferric-dicitrate binding protein FerR (iron transport regulator)
MAKKLRAPVMLAAALLCASVNVAAAEPSTRSASLDEAHSTAHGSVLKIQLVDGTELAVLADDNLRSAADASRQGPQRATTKLDPQVPQILMRRRGQIFDPATPGVVASIRG